MNYYHLYNKEKQELEFTNYTNINLLHEELWQNTGKLYYAETGKKVDLDELIEVYNYELKTTKTEIE